MVLIKYKDYHLDIPKKVYLPSDDTYLLIDSLKKENLCQKTFLEVGPRLRNNIFRGL
jgi:methylase of polypeptide subunit release factors